MFATSLYGVFGGSNSSASLWSRFICGNFFRSSGMRSESSSIAVRLSVFFASSDVKMPCPGPISITVSFGEISAVVNISVSVSWFMRKFWPRCFLGAFSI